MYYKRTKIRLIFVMKKNEMLKWYSLQMSFNFSMSNLKTKEEKNPSVLLLPGY